MPFLSNDNSFTKAFQPIPIDFFIRWRDTYISRNIRFHIKNDKKIVDLSEDNLFVTFTPTAILDLIKNAPEGSFLTIQFMCEYDGNKQYKKLSATICVMSKLARISDFILPISPPSVPPTPPDLSAIMGMKENYLYRKSTILNSAESFKNKEEFQKDEVGISHEISTDLKNYLEEAKRVKKNINVVFVKIPIYETDIKIPSDRRDKMTVVFAKEGIDVMDDTALYSSNMKLYDLGQACCPPQ